jgi:hypothetical protein
MTSITLAVSDSEHPVPGISPTLADRLFCMHAQPVQAWIAEHQTPGAVVLIARPDWLNRGGFESLTIPMGVREAEAMAAIWERVNNRELDDIMGLDHVIRVETDGTITDRVPGVYAPELFMSTADDDCHSILDEHEKAYIEDARRQGWEILDGFSGQDRYSGPIMHTSESIGGYLEDHIRTHPGLWVAVSVETDDDSDDAAGWVVLHREK